MSAADGPWEQANARFRARDFVRAEALLRDVIARDARHAGALRLLGLLAGRAGRDAECTALLERAIAHGMPAEQVASGLLLAAAHARAGRVAGAEAAFRAVLRIEPGKGEALLKLGLLLQGAGRHDEAAVTLRAATAADAGLAVAHAALAAALLALGKIDAAARSAEEAVRLAPGERAFGANLAVVRNAQGRFTQATALCRTLLAQGEDAALRNTLGVALKESDALDEAAAAFERAVELDPAAIDARFNLAVARKDQARSDEAVALLREVVAEAPELAAARFALCMAHLPPFYEGDAEIARRRAGYETELSALEAYADRAGAGTLAAGIGAVQPFYLAAQGRNDRDLQRRYGTLVCRAMAEAFAPVPLADPPGPGTRIRLGVVCGYLRDHSVWRLPTRGWIEALDRGRFELTAYHTSALRDDETHRAETLFDRFVQGPQPLARWRSRIAADRPHALLYPEIGMDPVAAQLAAMRLAPVQYASWGHPSASGYPTIDHFLSSAAMEPPDADVQYSEGLVRLPGLSTPVTVTPYAGVIPPRSALGLSEHATVFWCGQSLHKYLPAQDSVFAAIAEAVPNARFVFLEAPGSPSLTARFRQRLSNPACHILPRMTAPEFRAAIGCADVVLDSIGWSGCNTLLDALAHALPIVTLRGPSMRAAHGAAILGALGLDRFVCGSADAYIRTAVALAGSGDGGALVRAALRASGRLEGTTPVRALEDHIASACLR